MTNKQDKLKKEIMEEFRKKFGRFYVDKKHIDLEKGEEEVLASDDVEEWIGPTIDRTREETLKEAIEIAKQPTEWFGTENSKEPSLEDQLFEQQAQIITNLEIAIEKTHKK